MPFLHASVPRRPTDLPIDVGELRDITGIEKIDLPQESPMPAWVWWLVGLSAVVLVIAAWKWWRRMAPQEPQVSREEIALAELDRIQNVAGELDAAEFHTRLGEIVREYLERRFQVPALHQTTQESLESLQRCNGLSTACQKSLAMLMERCDLAKFARASFSTAENLESVSLSRGIINATNS